MEVVAVKGTLRDSLGKGGAKSVRKTGLVPGIIYGSETTIHVSVSPKELKPLIYTPEFKVANVDVDGKNYRCIIKDTQFHPQTDELLHIDLLHLEEGKTVKVEVPIRITGQAPGVKIGGKLYQKLRRAKIKTAVENLVDSMSIDVSELELGFSVRVKDIVAVEGIEIMNSPGIPVASVEVPRALRSARDAEAEEGAAGEGEEGAVGEGEGEEGAAPAAE
jgi:large subunit ribosomal protein L25